jgi:hypothetical protein
MNDVSTYFLRFSFVILIMNQLMICHLMYILGQKYLTNKVRMKAPVQEYTVVLARRERDFKWGEVADPDTVSTVSLFQSLSIARRNKPVYVLVCRYTCTITLDIEPDFLSSVR